MKSQKMIEIDDMVEKWQTTKDELLAKQLFDKFKYYFYSKSKDDDDMSDAQLAFTRALQTWDKSSNVWFTTWFQRLWMQHRRERSQYNKQQKRSGKEIIPIDSTTLDGEVNISEVIEDTKATQNFTQTQNAKILMDWINAKPEITEREKQVIYNIYFDLGFFQTDIAKRMNVSQRIIHKTIKTIKDKPYAEELKTLLKELMQK